MERFDRKGMLIIPNPMADRYPARRKVLVVKELYCPRGHGLLSPRAVFDEHPGILVGARDARGDEGLIALSPIFGDKRRVALDLDLASGELLSLHCPECLTPLPAHSPCECGGELTALFLTPAADFADCIGVCNRVDCVNAKIISSGEMVSLAMIDTL